MLMNLYNRLGTTLYIQIWENRVKATDIKTKNIYDEQPYVAIETTDKNQKIISAIGANALSAALKSNTELINPFYHPRTLLSDFQVGEKLLQHVVKIVLGKKWFTPLPAIVIHPMEKSEGGLSELERRAFRELAYSAGAREVILYEGKELPTHNFDYKLVKASEEETNRDFK